MITVRLDDLNVAHNIQSILELQRTGNYSDDELQKLYDKQVENDKKKDIVLGQKSPILRASGRYPWKSE